MLIQKYQRNAKNKGDLNKVDSQKTRNTEQSQTGGEL
jgi:hypothetical protein